MDGKKVKITVAMRGGVDVLNPSKRTRLQYTETVDVRNFTRARAFSWIRQTLFNSLSHELDECFRVVSYERPYDPHRGDA